MILPLKIIVILIYAHLKGSAVFAAPTGRSVFSIAPSKLARARLKEETGMFDYGQFKFSSKQELFEKSIAYWKVRHVCLDIISPSAFQTL